MGKKNKGNPASPADVDDGTPLPVSKKQKGENAVERLFSYVWLVRMLTLFPPFQSTARPRNQQMDSQTESTPQ
jgi:hypothetical protein